MNQFLDLNLSIELLHERRHYNRKYDKAYADFSTYLINGEYIFAVSHEPYGDYYNKSEYICERDDDSVLTYFSLISEHRNEVLELSIENIVRETGLLTNMKKIKMVSANERGLYLKDFLLGDDIVINDFDLHYGEGFEIFNNRLIEKINNHKKGLILFHGDPGTGKSYYLRYLLEKIENKNILYFPPTMVQAVTDPSFIDFISSSVSKDKNSVLLIEDAEPLLYSRDTGRNIGISNLLNLTDGLLNDLFNIQIIATFNTDFKTLDEALLRPERLLARKEFHHLEKKSAIKLAKLLGITIPANKDKMSLAQIYSIKNENETLIHDITEEKKLGFKIN